MNTINLKKYANSIVLPVLAGLITVFMVWQLITHSPPSNSTTGAIDPSFLQVIALAFCTWLLLLAIALSLLGWVLAKIISQLHELIEPLKKLTSLQQHVLYLALFAALLLSGTGCLMAIC